MSNLNYNKEINHIYEHSSDSYDSPDKIIGTKYIQYINKNYSKKNGRHKAIQKKQQKKNKYKTEQK